MQAKIFSQQAWKSYAIALALVLLAASLRIWPLQNLGLRIPYVTFYPAVMIAALSGGLAVGLVTMLMSALAILFWSPTGEPFIRDAGDWLGMAVFILNCTLISVIAEAMRRAQARAKKAQIEVEAANRALKGTMADLEQREAELAGLNLRLTELDRAKTEFFANVSHEFRTPLTLILGPLEELLEWEGEGDSTRRKESLQVAYRNVLRLTKLVNTLLDFSRIEAGRSQARGEPTDLAALTADLASNFRSACEQAGLTLTVDCPPLPQLINVDRGMWEKIVLNLLSNAFKFTFEGDIAVRLQSVDDKVELRVRDTGTGIPERELTRIFERFHRVEGARGRSFEGSGIGLALVRELVELHGGTIRVESEIGRGTCFIVQIPWETNLSIATETSPRHPAPIARAFVEEALRWLPNEDSRAKGIELAEAEPSGSLSAVRPGAIIVADDNADMRAYLHELLSDAGHSVLTVSNGNEALESALAMHPDLILSDVMMPGIDGLKLLKILRENPTTASLPIILLSARAGEEARIEGLAAGADDYLIKPFQARELVARIDGALRLAQARRDATEALRRAAAVFDNTSEAILVTDGERNIVSVNGAYTKISGFTMDEVLGKNPRLQKSGRHDKAFYEQLWQNLEHNGHWQGEIWNRRKNGEIYPSWENISVVKDEQGRVANYVSIFSDISAIKAAEEQLRQMAHCDSLTGLPNRLMFANALPKTLKRAPRHQKKVALLFLDLDRFKLINDTLGHAAGDELLQEVARRLQQCVRDEDLVARLGGDEFTIVLEEVNEPEDVSVVARKIIAALAEPIFIQQRKIVTSTSIGISIYPTDADNAEDLAKAADAAMYRAKARGRNTFEFYTAQLTLEVLRHLAVEYDLREALANQQFELYYQPQVDLATGRIIGVEALLRWHHPIQGLMLPDEFIRVAEESGLIQPIGAWVMREACKQAVAWLMAGLSPLRMAINISSRQLLHDHLLPSLSEAIHESGLDPSKICIELEITEGILQSAESAPILQDLKKLGVTIAIDDFGTGYSSLSRIKHLPIDTLKIDKGFIHDIPDDVDDKAISAAIISMAHNLGLKVIAEGVENEAQLSFLRSQGCAFGQGHLFSPAVPAADIAKLSTQFLFNDRTDDQ